MRDTMQTATQKAAFNADCGFMNNHLLPPGSLLSWPALEQSASKGVD
jgi:hypothetical protein